MNKKLLKKQYDELIEDVKNGTLHVFDGRNTGVDVYSCEKCGSQFYTRYKDFGVTPFTLTCRECQSTMLHRETISEEESKARKVIVHDWFRPTFEQLLQLSEGMQEHVLNGGLILEEHLNHKK